MLDGLEAAPRSVANARGERGPIVRGAGGVRCARFAFVCVECGRSRTRLKCIRILMPAASSSLSSLVYFIFGDIRIER